MADACEKPHKAAARAPKTAQGKEFVITCTLALPVLTSCLCAPAVATTPLTNGEACRLCMMSSTAVADTRNFVTRCLSAGRRRAVNGRE